MDIKQISKVWPGVEAAVIYTQHGTAVKLTGTGAKSVANHLAHENYLNGDTDTRWRDVRHGLGYLVPLYNNPISAIL